MKNISTLLIVLLFAYLNLNAQNYCPTAISINPGTITVTELTSPSQILTLECAENFGVLIDKTRWYKYTASVDGAATVSSSLAQNSNTDTRFHVYTGTCSTLACLAGNDDEDVTGGVKTSEDTFPVSNGSTYYIVWDNRWSTSGFDFTLSETAVTCSNGSSPIVEDFDDLYSFVACLTVEDADANGANFDQRSDNLDGAGEMETFATNGSISNLAKNDWLFSAPINLISGHEYNIEFKYNGANGTFNANEDLEVYFIDGPSSGSNVLTSLFFESGISASGTYAQSESLAYSEFISYTSTATDVYYLAFNSTSPINTGSLMLFEYSVTDTTLGVSEFSLEGITKSYNKQTDILTLNSNNLVLDGIEIYNILGQEVYNKSLSKQVEHINLSGLFDGIYIIRVSSAGQTYSTKLLKQ